MALTEAEKQFVQEQFNKLINRNGGHAVITARLPHKIGDRGEAYGFCFTVIGVATEEEAKQEASFLGLQFWPNNYYYKFVVD